MTKKNFPTLSKQIDIQVHRIQSHQDEPKKTHTKTHPNSKVKGQRQKENLKIREKH